MRVAAAAAALVAVVALRSGRLEFIAVRGGGVEARVWRALDNLPSCARGLVRRVTRGSESEKRLIERQLLNVTRSHLCEVQVLIRTNSIRDSKLHPLLLSPSLSAFRLSTLALLDPGSPVSLSPSAAHLASAYRPSYCGDHDNLLSSHIMATLPELPAVTSVRFTHSLAPLFSALGSNCSSPSCPGN